MASSAASTSSSVVDQPTESRRDRCASTPIAASTGDGSSASDEHALPECAAMPDTIEAEQHRLRLDAGNAEAHEMGQAMLEIAVGHELLADAPRMRSVNAALRGGFRDSTSIDSERPAPNPAMAGTFSKPARRARS